MRTKDGIEIEYGHIQESWWKYQFTWNQFLGKYYYSGERLIVERPLTAESASVMELMDGYWTQSLTEFKKFKGVIRYINTDQDVQDIPYVFSWIMLQLCAYLNCKLFARTVMQSLNCWCSKVLHPERETLWRCPLVFWNKHDLHTNNSV